MKSLVLSTLFNCLDMRGSNPLWPAVGYSGARPPHPDASPSGASHLVTGESCMPGRVCAGAHLEMGRGASAGDAISYGAVQFTVNADTESEESYAPCHICFQRSANALSKRNPISWLQAPLGGKAAVYPVCPSLSPAKPWRCWHLPGPEHLERTHEVVASCRRAPRAPKQPWVGLTLIPLTLCRRGPRAPQAALRGQAGERGGAAARDAGPGGRRLPQHRAAGRAAVCARPARGGGAPWFGFAVVPGYVLD